MYEKDIAEQEHPFYEKINDCCERMFAEHFPDLSLPESAEKFAQIAAAFVVYGGLLSSSLDETDIEYLMQFDNPLQLVAETWHDEQLWPEVDIEINHAISQMKDAQVELYSPLDPKYSQVQTMG
jgi:hypothetical protein